MISRWIVRAIPALVLAGLLLGPQDAAQAAPVTARPLAAAGAAAQPAPQAAAGQLRNSAVGSVSLVDGVKKDKDKGKSKSKAKKKGFFKKLGIAALIGTVLIVLLVIAIIVAIVFAVRRRRRREA
ncbi:hypothetical protein ACFWIB_40080 [Streptomyces sp. NPDC127051]|uniref:hypothetical protein n=1 Tax=Streptomyces sp. NPDC127051 TaxID=3347119 RepID=UPI0036623618